MQLFETRENPQFWRQHPSLPNFRQHLSRHTESSSDLSHHKGCELTPVALEASWRHWASDHNYQDDAGVLGLAIWVEQLSVPCLLARRLPSTGQCDVGKLCSH